jgi:hypothetical protein
MPRKGASKRLCSIVAKQAMTLIHRARFRTKCVIQTDEAVMKISVCIGDNAPHLADRFWLERRDRANCGQRNLRAGPESSSIQTKLSKHQANRGKA